MILPNPVPPQIEIPENAGAWKATLYTNYWLICWCWIQESIFCKSGDHHFVTASLFLSPKTTIHHEIHLEFPLEHLTKISLSLKMIFCAWFQKSNIKDWCCVEKMPPPNFHRMQEELEEVNLCLTSKYVLLKFIHIIKFFLFICGPNSAERLL